ncbi:hypothetical protein GE21DRAFT_3718 [Neurospora crassa]|uniref:Uncharacterized protein n=1 Tax=Neurospora crassa (strain ATCC 24698 / 74-OR23-1A / CBS 708.71 / DSM 1257 / FGSC 987) TaxID=367110 RepID=Q7S018_NEUCR|nr:hypothetical protein NCU09762 [Neurospora crassa OR74A]EAA28635.1 hypothetical protein NCU09762 [Neurospora crassa OR74A]KHE79053.1 hypothetical protein GE21DRAFT_3718 [Neurospora crassa]|eukprot:XP_957871.1 hypothetical protein NCU09762 [Neurospora crassa OR74A]
MSSLRPPPAPTPTTLLNKKRASPTLAEPESLITPPASITKSIASRYSQIHNQENTSIRTAGTRLQIQVDFNRGLWNFCLANKQIVGNCWMPGACFDQDKCKDGCGFLDRKDLSTALCSSQDSSGNTIRATICVNAYLTLDNGLGPFQRIDCGWTTGISHYTASQADAIRNPAVTTTTSSSSSGSSSSTPPTPSQSSGNGGGNNNSANIGAIVGGVIGGLAIICAFGFAAYLVWAYRVRGRRRKKTAHNASEPLNGGSHGDGSDLFSSSSSASEDDDTPSMTTNLPLRANLPLSHSPDTGGQPYQRPPEVAQHARDAGDGSGGWGPREMESGFERGGYAHEQQGLHSDGSHEVLSVEKVVEMPVKIEPVEMSSGWEDQPPGIRRPGREGGGGYGHEMS